MYINLSKNACSKLIVKFGDNNKIIPVYFVT